MALPLYGVEAGGGKVFSLDDEAVVQDQGVGITAYILSSIFDLGDGYAKLRRLVQHVHVDDTVSLQVTPYRDEVDTGNSITTSLAVGDSPIVVTPLNESGTNFQVKVAFIGLRSATEIGKAEISVIPRRTQR